MSVYEVMERCFILLQTSEAVTLDLLTYSDLELLRNRKMGQPSKVRSQPQSPALSTKRYFILVYTVEFDRSVPASFLYSV